MDLQELNMFFKFLVFILLFVISQTRADSCKTPNNESGKCILLRECPLLREMIANKTKGSSEFVRQSICGFADVDSLVCCASPTNNNTLVINQENKETKNNQHLLPSRKYCGYQHSDDYSHDTNSTLITEFPWLARLAYRRVSESEDAYVRKYACLGSLINPNYVLTAAQCFTNPFVVLMEVRLGEYHLANDTDCVSEDIVQECSDPVKDYTVNKTIVHPEYNKVSHTNDIALLRINGKVLYSDYIRPICLPLPDTKFANVGDTMTISGWGVKNFEGEKAVIKKRVLAELISTENCAEKYKEKTEVVVITDNFLCTTIFSNSTELSCTGDAGAPVIISHRLQWHQEGIVSFGETKCGQRIPDVHTRVQKYLEWIEENIEP